MDKNTPKAKYKVGEFAIYIPPEAPAERNLCILDYTRYDKNGWQYSGRMLKIRETGNPTLPFIPVFDCGLGFAPEKRFRKLEDTLKELHIEI